VREGVAISVDYRGSVWGGAVQAQAGPLDLRNAKIRGAEERDLQRTAPLRTNVSCGVPDDHHADAAHGVGDVLAHGPLGVPLELPAANALLLEGRAIPRRAASRRALELVVEGYPRCVRPICVPHQRLKAIRAARRRRLVYQVGLRVRAQRVAV